MAQAILVPQVGQDLTEAKVVELHVKLGDRVKKGDLVAVVESEKASFEVEAFAEGVVIGLPYREGDIATVLEPLVHLGQPGEALPGAPAAAPLAAPASPAAAAAAPVSSGPASSGPAAPVAAPSAAMSNPARRASPVARLAAHAQGLDVAAMAGSGPGGAVVLKDVEALAGSAGAGGSARAAADQAVIGLRTLQAGQGMPVLFIHGFGADLSSWRPLIARLPLGSPLLALDLPGHGASRSVSADSFDAIVAAVGAALSGLQGAVHLVGHSLGSAVAVALSARGDLDIRSLTLLSPAGLGPSVDGAFVEGYLAARSEAALAVWMRRLVCDPAALAPVLVRATHAAREDGALVPAQRSVARAVFEGGTQLFSVEEMLRRYSGPVSVIAGRDDAIVPLHEIEAAVPGHAALYRLEGVGHLPQVEAADIVQTVIARTVRSAG